MDAQSLAKQVLHTSHVPAFHLSDTEQAALSAESKRLRRAAEHHLFMVLSSATFQQPPFTGSRPAQRSPSIPSADPTPPGKTTSASRCQHTTRSAMTMPSKHSHAEWPPGTEPAEPAGQLLQKLASSTRAARSIKVQPSVPGLRSDTGNAQSAAGALQQSGQHSRRSRPPHDATPPDLDVENSDITLSPSKHKVPAAEPKLQQKDHSWCQSAGKQVARGPSGAELEARLQQIQRHLAEVCTLHCNYTEHCGLSAMHPCRAQPAWSGTHYIQACSCKWRSLLKI